MRAVVEMGALAVWDDFSGSLNLVLRGSAHSGLAGFGEEQMHMAGKDVGLGQLPLLCCLRP